MSETYNVAAYLPKVAEERPSDVGIYTPGRKYPDGRLSYQALSFKELNELSDAYCIGLKNMGVTKGTRVLLMVRPGEELIALAFSLFKLAAVPVLIDPGMGVKSLLRCIQQSQPEVLLGIPLAHSLSRVFQRSFSSIKKRVTVGGRLFWGGAKLSQFRKHLGQKFDVETVGENDLAAVLFTSGSTGAPKGVRYEHGQFMAQVQMLRENFKIKPGEIDLPMLPIFALFNPALGMTTVIPKMNPSKPAEVKPEYIVDAIERFSVTNSFGSPVLWKKVCKYCKTHDIKLKSLKRVLMAGAPVAPKILEDFYSVSEGADAYTPYGATEALPLTAVSGKLILDEMSGLTRTGKGTCVGKPLSGIEMRIDTQEKPNGHKPIGEILVSGKVVTRSYDSLPEATKKAKLIEGDKLWHRMGDMGYFDDEGNLWFCGRMSHKVECEEGIFYSVCCEAIFNEHPSVNRSALIGLRSYKTVIPAIVIEPVDPTRFDMNKVGNELLALAKKEEITETISTFFVHTSFPVDVRHNAKIDREALAIWAQKQQTLKTVLN